jgi:preprotein translocase subunit SecG
VTIFVSVLHVVVCIALIIVVLLQRGKGAEIGAVFGGGASSTVFGSRGAGNFLTKLTTWAAVIFMGTSLYLSYVGSLRFSRGLFDEEGNAKPAESSSQFAEPPAAPQPAEGAPAVQPPPGGAPESGAPAVQPPASGAPAPQAP